jgi:hypothetical protein
MDEIWRFVGKKERLTRIDDNPTMGSVGRSALSTLGQNWFLHSELESVMLPGLMLLFATWQTAWHIGCKSPRMGLEQRLRMPFGGDVDYGQIIKVYGIEESITPQRRYSAASIESSQKKAHYGSARFRPDFYQLRRTPECDHSPSHAPSRPSNVGIQQKARKL